MEVQEEWNSYPSLPMLQVDTHLELMSSQYISVSNTSEEAQACAKSTPHSEVSSTYKNVAA